MREVRLERAETAMIAHENYEATVALKGEIARNFLVLGGLLNESLDNSYWKLLGHDSFESYVATPEIALSRSYAYQCVKLYRVFQRDMGIDAGELSRIGPSRLIAMLPAVKDAAVSDYAEMMSDAEHLSLSDLGEKYGHARPHKGRESGESDDKTDRPEPTKMSFDEWKLRSGCAVCGDSTVEKAHLPHSKGAGGDEDHWVPLCREHHQEQHDKGVQTFILENYIQLMTWFHWRLEAAWNRGGE